MVRWLTVPSIVDRLRKNEVCCDNSDKNTSLTRVLKEWCRAHESSESRTGIQRNGADRAWKTRHGDHRIACAIPDDGANVAVNRVCQRQVSQNRCERVPTECILGNATI
jgi:hypothetical protein